MLVATVALASRQSIFDMRMHVIDFYGFTVETSNITTGSLVDKLLRMHSEHNDQEIIKVSASEMTYTVSGGALNSTQSNPVEAFSRQEI